VLAGASLLVAAEQGGRASAPAFPKTFSDVGITLLDEWVADLDLSVDGKWIGYPRRDPRDWYLDIWAVRPTGQDRHCLTCELPEPSKHRGSVSWHPSGQYLAFSAENDDVRTRKGDRLAEPGSALNTNLWAMTASGGKAWKLTDYETDYVNPRGVLHPLFSRDGKRLCWSGPVGRSNNRKGYEWGEWAISMADFDVQNGVPGIRNTRTLQPGVQHAFYQADDWSKDGRRLLLSANPRVGQTVSGQDIYEFEIETGTLRRLTRSDTDWDQAAHYSPDGRHVIWTSSRGLNVRFRSVDGLNWRRDLATELWVMNKDGSGARRLTYFNERGWRDYAWFRDSVAATRRVTVADCAFMPDGDHAVIVLSYETKQGQMNSVLAVLDIERRRQAAATPASPTAR
jgi:Tol biopolymer transport system component